MSSVSAAGSEDIKRTLDEWSRSSIVSKNWKIGLLAVLLGFVVSAISLWTMASNEMLARIQTFNGALTIPVGALTWAFAFTFVFLIPMKAMQILMCRVMKYNIEVAEKTVGVLDSIQADAKSLFDRGEAFLKKLEGAEGKTRAKFDRMVSSMERLADSFDRPILPAPIPRRVGGNGKDSVEAVRQPDSGSL